VVCSDASAFLAGSSRRFDLVLCNHSLHACATNAAGGLGKLAEGIATAMRPAGAAIAADVFFDEGATGQEIDGITHYEARSAACLCTGVYRAPGTLRAADMESIFLGAGLHLLGRHDAPWFALSAYEGLRQARYALAVFVKPGSSLPVARRDGQTERLARAE